MWATPRRVADGRWSGVALAVPADGSSTDGGAGAQGSVRRTPARPGDRPGLAGIVAASTRRRSGVGVGIASGRPARRPSRPRQPRPDHGPRATSNAASASVSRPSSRSASPGDQREGRLGGVRPDRVEHSLRERRARGGSRRPGAARPGRDVARRERRPSPAKASPRPATPDSAATGPRPAAMAPPRRRLDRHAGRRARSSCAACPRTARRATRRPLDRAAREPPGLRRAGRARRSTRPRSHAIGASRPRSTSAAAPPPPPRRGRPSASAPRRGPAAPARRAARAGQRASSSARASGEQAQAQVEPREPEGRASAPGARRAVRRRRLGAAVASSRGRRRWRSSPRRWRAGRHDGHPERLVAEQLAGQPADVGRLRPRRPRAPRRA